MPDETERPDWTGGDGKPVDNHGVQRMAFPVVAGEIVRADWGEGGEKNQLPVEVHGRPASVPATTTGVAVRPDWSDEGAPLTPSSPARQGGLDHPPAGQELVELEGAELAKAERDATEIMAMIPEADQTSFLQGFDALEERSRAIVNSELGNVEGGRFEVADAGQLEAFASTPEGAELAAEWGGKAGINLGFVQARIERMIADDPDGMEPVLDWFDDLSSSEAKAVLQVLAG